MAGFARGFARTVVPALTLVGMAVVTSNAGADRVPDYITTDTWWTRAGNPWTIANNVMVRSGATLTVEAGVVVEVDGYWRLETDSTTGGDIVAEGAPWDSVYFRALGGGGEDLWQGIQINITTGSSFDYCVVLNANKGLTLNTSDTPITHCAFRRCETGIWCWGASPEITSSWVSETSLAGILCERRTPSVPASQPVIFDCNLFDNAGYNVQLLGYASGGMTTIDARSTWWGTSVESEIKESIYDNADATDILGIVDYNNWLGETPVEEQSWGAIKAMFRE